MSFLKMRKSDAFAVAALILTVIFFTFPMIVFKGTPEKIRSGRADEVRPLVCSVWNLYQKGRYVSPYINADAAGDLRKIIESRGEVGAMSAPVWRVSLEAPNYPKEAFPSGIPVYFHLDGYSGDVHEMNTINHFIGMYPMERGAALERAAAPYIMLFVAFAFVFFLLYKGRFSWVPLLVPAFFPIGFFAFYSGWLYWYGHNLQEWGMFKVKPFMPTALGDGRVAQFTTHSYPAFGFYVLLLTAALSVLAILARRKERG